MKIKGVEVKSERTGAQARDEPNLGRNMTEDAGQSRSFSRTALMILAFFVISCSGPSDNIGTVEDLERNRSISYRIWVPSSEGDFGKHPLVVISHGSGGEYSNHNWLIASLVANGFVVAGLNHPLNTTRDNSDEGVVSVWNRPRDITVMLDYLLADSRWAGIIDEARIGAAGFSSGGYTVIALAGAIYNSELMGAHCVSEKRTKDCELATDYSNVDFRDSSASYKDARIKSVFAMAPAVGSAITKESLLRIEIPVYITAARDDELVSSEHGAIRYAEFIPLADLALLPSGGHFIFLECNGITTVVDWLNSELDLCGTNFDVDRDKVRKAVSVEAINFFAKTLKAGAP